MKQMAKNKKRFGNELWKKIKSTVISLPDVSRNGYKFKGWYASPNGVGTIDTYSRIKSYDHTVYAQWTTESYTVTYE